MRVNNTKNETKFEEIFETILNEYPNEWLLPLEILEFTEREQLADSIQNFLSKKMVNQPNLKVLIREGMEMIGVKS